MAKPATMIFSREGNQYINTINSYITDQISTVQLTGNKKFRATLNEFIYAVLQYCCWVDCCIRQKFRKLSTSIKIGQMETFCFFYIRWDQCESDRIRHISARCALPGANQPNFHFLASE